MGRRQWSASAKLGQHLERWLVGLVYLDPRLTAAYQVGLSEAAVGRDGRPSTAMHDLRETTMDLRQAAAGVVA